MLFSHNEWSRLKKVILGRIDGANNPEPDLNQRLIRWCHHPDKTRFVTGPFPKRLIEETQEDLENFAGVLRSFEIEVLRPTIIPHSSVVSNGWWQTTGYYSYCPRDIATMIGHRIIESPMSLRARQFETNGLKSIFLSCMKEGNAWISAPKPLLLDESFNTEESDSLALSETEPVFDAANLLRCGRDVFYLVSNTGNELGRLWLANILGDDYNIHPLRRIYDSSHIDSTLMILRPGTVLLNPERIHQIPEVFRSWEILWAPDPVDNGHLPGYNNATPWLSINVLSIDESIVIVEQNQLPLIRLLEKYGFTVVPVRLRHSQSLGGGPHCCTLDIDREGELESYFD